MDKAALRRRFLAERQAFPAARRDERSAAIVGHLARWLSDRGADVVGLYHPVRSEPDVLGLAEPGVSGLAGASRGLQFALPVVGELPGAMLFHAYRPGDELVKSRQGILEPRTTQPVVAFTVRSVAVVPAVALDRKGVRLGYGGGYYDRFLKDFPGTAIGVVFSGFLVDRLPAGPHDVHLPFTVTELGIAQPGSRAAHRP